VIPSLEDC
jgi:hypothetical protein